MTRRRLAEDASQQLRLRSLVVCDDVRREDNGKELLIGVYAGTIRFLGDCPGKLRQLCFRVECDAQAEKKYEVQFQLYSPAGITIINTTARIDVIRRRRAVLALTHLDLVLYEAGIYEIRIGIDAEEPQMVDHLRVVFAEPKRRGATEPKE
jgi:hypothetical protein